MRKNAETDLTKVKKQAKSLWRKFRKEGSPVKISAIYEQLARNAGCAHWYEYCVVLKKIGALRNKSVAGH